MYSIPGNYMVITKTDLKITVNVLVVTGLFELLKHSLWLKRRLPSSILSQFGGSQPASH